jgi:phospholipid/cholesterol/gamma-HCH transport system substrate-binding protein
MHATTPLRTAAVVIALAVGGLLTTGASGGDYEVSVVLDNASNLVKGGPVLVNGFEAGHVRSVKVQDGKALVDLALDKDFAPLHDGARIVTSWKATLSERRLDITDGPASNAAVPDNGMVPGEQPAAMELDDVLAALDGPTRAHLASSVQRLRRTVSGQEKDTAETLAAAGPALEALGKVTQAVGADEPAINDLVVRVNAMMEVLARRDGQIRDTVDSLGAVTDEVAARRKKLRGALRELPPTLGALRGTMQGISDAADDAVPLLKELAPATAKLGPLAHDLKPVMQDLRPLAADLRPALASANELLQYTPGLLDGAHALLPEGETALDRSAAAVAYMRPYTPEITGYLSTWASSFANYDANGNFARFVALASGTSLNANPGIVPPGLTDDPYPVPGAVVKQPWTDAFGSEMR